MAAIVCGDIAFCSPASMVILMMPGASSFCASGNYGEDMLIYGCYAA